MSNLGEVNNQPYSNNPISHMSEMGNADVKETGQGTEAGSNVKVLEERSRKRQGRAQSQRDTEMDQECVLYEFVELLVRIAFQRANPKFGAPAPPSAALAAAAGGGGAGKPASPVGCLGDGRVAEPRGGPKADDRQAASGGWNC